MTMICLIMMTLLRKIKFTVCDLIDRTTFNDNEQIYVETKDPEMIVFNRGNEIDKNGQMSKWSLTVKIMKMLLKKIKLQKK